MFAKFKLDPVRLDNSYYKIGKSIYLNNQNKVRKTLNKYVVDNNQLSAKRIERDWFPQIHADVFLSHSHADERMAIALAGYLHDWCGIDVFVDSCVWSYCEELIDLMEFEWNQNNDPSISRQICSHVYMMLNTALHKMIYKTECLILLNTPNSIAFDAFGGESELYSPWIYSELLMGNMVQRRSLAEHRKDGTNEYIKATRKAPSSVKIKYELDINDYMIMSVDDLNEWTSIVLENV